MTLRNVHRRAQNLATHKLRTALTMLGMIFGVGAVIAMLSIGAGGEKKALEAIGRLGLRNVIVRAKTVKPEERAELRKKSLGVSLRDGEAISEAVPSVEMRAAAHRGEAVQDHRARREDEGEGLRRVVALSRVAAVSLAEGRFFDARDEQRARAGVPSSARRCGAISSATARRIGKQLKVNDVWLEVDRRPRAATRRAARRRKRSCRSHRPRRRSGFRSSTAMRKFDRDPLDAPVDELLVDGEGRRLHARHGAS